jgi:hypothetical protein
MLKNILNLVGAQQLSKKELKNSIGRGQTESIEPNDSHEPYDPKDPRCQGKLCPKGYMCLRGDCVGI